jgi:hypothetical protein
MELRMCKYACNAGTRQSQTQSSGETRKVASTTAMRHNG